MCFLAKFQQFNATVTLSQYHKPQNEHTPKLSRKITKNAKLSSITLLPITSEFNRVHVDSLSNTIGTKCRENLGTLYEGFNAIASSLVSRGLLGTLPGDSSWKSEEGSTEHFPRWLVFSDGQWTVTGLCPLPA